MKRLRQTLTPMLAAAMSSSRTLSMPSPSGECRTHRCRSRLPAASADAIQKFASKKVS